MTVGYLTRDRSGVICLHLERPHKKNTQGYWLSNSYVAIEEEHIPSEVRTPQWNDRSPVKVNLIMQPI